MNDPVLPTQSTHSGPLLSNARSFMVLAFSAVGDFAAPGKLHEAMVGAGHAAWAQRLKRASVAGPTDTLWQRVDAGTWFDDRYFYPFVRNIFGLDANATAAAPAQSLPALELSAAALKTLAGANAAGDCGDWCVRLSDGAVNRLHQAGAVSERIVIGEHPKPVAVARFGFESVRALFFGTGVCMLVFELRFERAIGSVVEHVLEANFALARAVPSGRSKDRSMLFGLPATGDAGASAALPRFTGLGELAHALLGGAASVYQPMLWGKVFAYTAIALDGQLPDTERPLLATRLARKESTDYQPLPDAVGESCYRPFAQLTHAVSIEGGSVIVEAGPGAPEFVQRFVENTASRTYLPLALWAYHDYLVLVGFMASTQGRIDFFKPTADAIDYLKAFRDGIYNYRFNYRFSHASSVSMHNDVLRHWRGAFHLHELLDEVTQDVAEAENYLETAQRDLAEQQLARRSRNLSILLGVIGIVVAAPSWTGLTLADLWVEATVSRAAMARWQILAALSIVAVVTAMALASAIVATGRSVWTWWRNRGRQRPALTLKK